jgi:hypothetical protein
MKKKKQNATGVRKLYIPRFVKRMSRENLEKFYLQQSETLAQAHSRNWDLRQWVSITDRELQARVVKTCERVESWSGAFDRESALTFLDHVEVATKKALGLL